MRTPGVTFAPALALALAGCSGSRPSAAPTADYTPPPDLATSAPASVAASSTPAASPSATAVATPTTIRPGHIPALDGDVDGDGTPDAMRSTATLLSIDLSGSGTTVTAAIHAESPRNAPILGTGDIDRDGRVEVFVETAEGASTQFVTPYRYDGKVLRELQIDGGPARLGMGGTVSHGEGFRCPNGLLEILSSDSADGATYTVHVSSYRMTGSRLVLVRTTTTRAKQGDPLVDASYRPDCGTVGDGG